MIERETFKKKRKEIGTPHVLQELCLAVYMELCWDVKNCLCFKCECGLCSLRSQDVDR